jgi:hypothetical protein
MDAERWMKHKSLTPEQIYRVNRILRHLASELERRKAIREAREQAQALANDVYRLCREMAEA